MLILLFAVLCNVHAERPIPARDGVYSVGTEFNYFQSNANYQLDGTSHSLYTGGSFNNLDLRTSFTYEMRKRFRFFTNVDYSQTSASNGTATEHNNGLNEFGLGAQYWFNLTQFSIVPQLQWRHPLWSLNESAGDSLIGDGVNVFEAGSFAIGRFGRWQPFAYIGYAKRDAGKATLMPYAVGVNWRPTQIWAEVQYRGYTPLSRDSDSNNRTFRDAFLSRVDGGSYRFDAVNPTLNEAVAQVGYRFGGGWNVYAGYTQTVNGNSSASGWTATVGGLFTARMFAPHHEESETPVTEPAPFQPANEKYDESLFNDSDPKKAPPTPPSRKSVDKMLNETEKKLNGEQ
jgi:hypothetical protein